MDSASGNENPTTRTTFEQKVEKARERKEKRESQHQGAEDAEIKVGQRRKSRSDKRDTQGKTTTRLDGKTQVFEMPSGPESILEQATKVTPEELAASICSMISEVGKMWAHNPEAAMGGIERMLIEVPLATYFEIPEVAEKVATHGTPFMAIGGFVIYATRVQMLRSTWQKEQAEKRQGSAMNQRGTLTQQPKAESPKPGRVNAEEFYRPPTDNDLNAQRGWLGSSPVGASDYDAMRAEATQHAMANPGSIGTKPLYEE